MSTCREGRYLYLDNTNFDNPNQGETSPGEIRSPIDSALNSALFCDDRSGVRDRSPDAGDGGVPVIYVALDIGFGVRNVPAVPCLVYFV
jgi:hypothetical protein